MKLLFVFIAVFAVVAADEWLPQPAEGVREIHRKCSKEVELTTEQLEKVENMEFPDEEAVRKYVLCLGQKARLFCRHAGYHPYRLIMQMDLNREDDEVREVLMGCLDENEQKSTIDVWAYRGQQCILNSKLGEDLRAIFKRMKEKLAAKDIKDAKDAETTEGKEE